MYRSSSATISAGVSAGGPASINLSGGPEGRADAPVMAPRPPTFGHAPAEPWRASGCVGGVSQRLDRQLVVRVDADAGRDAHAFGDDGLRIQIRVGDARAGGAERVRPARA